MLMQGMHADNTHFFMSRLKCLTKKENARTTSAVVKTLTNNKNTKNYLGLSDTCGLNTKK